MWTGWPTVVGIDDTVLAMIGLDLPEHQLTVKRAPAANRQKDYKRVRFASLLRWKEFDVSSFYLWPSITIDKPSVTLRLRGGTKGSKERERYLICNLWYLSVFCGRVCFFC